MTTILFIATILTVSSPILTSVLAALFFMVAIQLISGFVTAPSTTVTAITLAAGDSLVVKNAPRNAYLLAAWGDWQTAGLLRIRSPRMHDNVRGITLEGVASEVYPLMFPPITQVLVPQDTLIVEMTGSATSADIESMGMLIFHPDLPGSNGRFLNYQQYLQRQMGNIFAVDNTLALGTAGGYSGEEAINVETDQFKGNNDYALLGFAVTAECCSIGWRGPGTGNLRVGGPGNETNKNVTRDWFVALAKATGWACIPVINSADKAATLVDGVQDENGTDTTVTSIFAQLR